LLQIQTTVNDLICIISQLQVAFTHPDNTSPRAHRAWQLKNMFIGMLDQVQPELGQFMREGNIGVFDKQAQADAAGDNGTGNGPASGPKILRPWDV
jgi:hypothetical protein